jgi:hypothetical protein
MTNRSKHDIANALKGLASGEHPEAEHHPEEGHGHTAPGAPVPPPVPPPVPAPVAPGSVQRAAGRPSRPVQPGGVAPQRAAAPGAPGAPSGSLGSAAAPSPAPAEFVDREPAPSQVVDDDDAMLMPAPSIDYLAHHPHQPAHPKRASVSKSPAFRQTVIPVLLTTGALMLVAVVLKWVVHPDAPLAAMPTWMVVLLVVSGIAILAVAGLNVIQVQRQTTGGKAAGGSSVPPS